MHRPDGWQEAKEKNIIATTDPVEKALQNVSFENGADAMLEGLRADGFHISVGQTLQVEGQEIKATKNQTLVLIPDD